MILRYQIHHISLQKSPHTVHAPCCHLCPEAKWKVSFPPLLASPSNLSKFLNKTPATRIKLTHIPKIKGQRSQKDTRISKIFCLTSINRQQTNASLSFFLCNMLFLSLLASSKLKIHHQRHLIAAAAGLTHFVCVCVCLIAKANVCTLLIGWNMCLFRHFKISRRF